VLFYIFACFYCYEFAFDSDFFPVFGLADTDIVELTGKFLLCDFLLSVIVVQEFEVGFLVVFFG
jgi:hypothetical protein